MFIALLVIDAVLEGEEDFDVIVVFLFDVVDSVNDFVPLAATAGLVVVVVNAVILVCCFNDFVPLATMGFTTLGGDVVVNAVILVCCFFFVGITPSDAVVVLFFDAITLAAFSAAPGYFATNSVILNLSFDITT